MTLDVHYRYSIASGCQFAERWNTTCVDYLNIKADDNPATTVQPLISTTVNGANVRVRSKRMLDWTRDIFGASWTITAMALLLAACIT